MEFLVSLVPWFSHSVARHASICVDVSPEYAGGFSNHSFTQHPLGAESDPLPPFLCFYSYLHSIGPEVGLYIKRFLYARMDARYDIEMLLYDPFALPINKPRTPYH